MSFAQRLPTQQTWEVKPSVYLKLNYRLSEWYRTLGSHLEWSHLGLQGLPCLKRKVEVSADQMLEDELIPLEVVSSPLLEVFEQRTIWQGYCQENSLSSWLVRMIIATTD